MLFSPQHSSDSLCLHIWSIFTPVTSQARSALIGHRKPDVLPTSLVKPIQKKTNIDSSLQKLQRLPSFKTQLCAADPQRCRKMVCRDFTKRTSLCYTNKSVIWTSCVNIVILYFIFSMDIRNNLVLLKANISSGNIKPLNNQLPIY